MSRSFLVGRSTRARAVLTAGVFFGCCACSSADNESGPTELYAGAAGTANTGGSVASSGGSGTSAATGGVNGVGGASSAGALGIGGAPSSGGATANGGSLVGGAMTGGATSGGATNGGANVGGITSGGRASSGGTSNRGGAAPGSGGRAPAGGAPNSGGTSSASGGRASAGGSTNSGGKSSASGGSSGGNTASGGSTTLGGAAGSSSCPYQGRVSYTLAKVASPTAEQQSAYDRITAAMDTAIRYYNCYTNITKVLNVSYVPSVATADGNINGSIRFGSTASMNRVTAMHEISHTVGIGTASNWGSFLSGGRFTGANAQAQLLAIPNRLAETIGADAQHFWPYGLNYESEGRNESDLIGHCQMVVAIRKDLGMS